MKITNESVSKAPKAPAKVKRPFVGTITIHFTDEINSEFVADEELAGIPRDLREWKDEDLVQYLSNSARYTHSSGDTETQRITNMLLFDWDSVLNNKTEIEVDVALLPPKSPATRPAAKRKKTA